MNVIEELKSQYEEASQLWESYEKKLQEFRSAVKNDITSLEAGARKTTDAAVKMKTAYSEVFAQLTGPEMSAAIENAERLAKALESIGALRSHKLSFVVVDSGSPDAKNPA